MVDFSESDASLKLWFDNGAGGGTAGDGIANGSEISTIDTDKNSGLHTSIISYNGSLAISYWRNDFPTTRLQLWLDDGYGSGVKNDVVKNGGEIRNLDSTQFTGSHNSMIVYKGCLVVSYYDIDKKTLYKTFGLHSRANNNVLNLGESWFAVDKHFVSRCHMLEVHPLLYKTWLLYKIYEREFSLEIIESLQKNM